MNTHSDRPLDIGLLHRLPKTDQEKEDQAELRRRLTLESSVAPVPVEDRLNYVREHAEKEALRLDEEQTRLGALQVANEERRQRLQERRDALVAEAQALSDEEHVTSDEAHTDEQSKEHPEEQPEDHPELPLTPDA